MDAISTYNGNTSTPKSFWKRSEGKAGMAILAGLGVVAAMGISKILPWIITLFSNAITATALGVGLFLLVAVITNKKVHTLISWGFKSIMWHLTDVFVDLDPIAIMKGYVEVLQKHVENIDEQLGKLRGHIDRLKRLILDNEKKISNSLSTVKAAQKRGEEGVIRNEGRQAGRLTEENGQLNVMLSKIDNTYNVMNRIREYASIKAVDISNEVESAIRLRDQYKTVGSALKSAKAIISGGEGKELYDAALEKMEQRYSAEVGNLEDFLVSTGDMMSAMDIEGDVATDKALQMLESLEQKSSLMLNSPKMPSPVMDADFQVRETVQRGSFSSIASKVLNQ